MSNKIFKPLGNRVLVRRDAAATMTPGGLHLAAVAQTKSDRGTVVSVGPGGRDLTTGQHIAVSVKPGDIVIFPRSAIEVDIGGEKLMMLQEPEIFAVEYDSEEAAQMSVVVAATTPSVDTPKPRKPRSDIGTKRGRRGGGVTIVTNNTTATPEQIVAAIETQVEKTLVATLAKASV